MYVCVITVSFSTLLQSLKKSLKKIVLGFNHEERENYFNLLLMCYFNDNTHQLAVWFQV